MSFLKISSVKYEGDEYSFFKDNIPSGVVAVVGPNGSGKTTFTSLIAYAFGSDPELLRDDYDKKHKEILNDKNNFVEIGVSINNEKFKFRRNINYNDITVYDEATHKAEIFPLIRNGDKEIEIFSDWFLRKLSITSFRVFDGPRSGLLNFIDIFRLMFYDQSDPPNLIQGVYRNNKVADSIYFRKAIFESLLGVSFASYYKLVESYKVEKVKYDKAKDSESEIEKVLKALKINSEISLNEVENEINGIDLTIETLKKNIPKMKPSNKSMDKEASEARQALSVEGDRLFSKEQELRECEEHISNFINVLRDAKSEIEVIERLLYTKSQMPMFNSETCPCCLRVVPRVTGKCICGEPIDERAYQRFFYETKEYKEILKSKTKSLRLTKTTLNELESSKKEIEVEIGSSKKQINLKQAELTRLLSEDVSALEASGITRVGEKIIEQMSRKSELEFAQVKLQDFFKIQKKVKTLKESSDNLKVKMDTAEKKSSLEMNDLINEFEETYRALIKDLVPNFTHADLDRDNYLPILNKGYHIQESTYVPKRLCYFLAALIVGGKVKRCHPRLLLIDTPETKGIDRENFRKSLDKLNILYEKFENEFQVILTTGPETLPATLKCTEIINLTEENKLLVKKDNKK